MFKHKDKKKTIILIVGSIFILVLLIGGGILWWKKNNSSRNLSEEVNTPNQPNNDSNKKDLAEKIINDLKERIERIKNSKNNPSPNDWNPYMVFDNRITCVVDGGVGFLKEKEEVFTSQIGTESYQEIVNLINQTKQAKEEWIKRRNQEFQEKAATNPNLFYCPLKSAFNQEHEFSEHENWSFSGKGKNENYKLIIPKNHSSLANIQIKSLNYDFYLITGVESAPLVPSPIDGTGLFKIVKLTDKITVENYKP